MSMRTMKARRDAATGPAAKPISQTYRPMELHPGQRQRALDLIERIYTLAWQLDASRKAGR